MKELLKLFFAFAKVGGFTFGGGYAMLPMLKKEIVNKNAWATEEEILNYYAIGQCTPGIIAVNTATFIGYKRKGVIGGMVATLGLIFPSLVIITIISAFLKNFSGNIYVQNAFAGIRVCVVVLVLGTIISMFKKAIKTKISYVIYIGVLLISLLTDVSAIVIVITVGMGCIIVECICHRKKQ